MLPRTETVSCFAWTASKRGLSFQSQSKHDGVPRLRMLIGRPHLFRSLLRYSLGWIRNVRTARVSGSNSAAAPICSGILIDWPSPLISYLRRNGRVIYGFVFMPKSSVNGLPRVASSLTGFNRIFPCLNRFFFGLE